MRRILRKGFKFGGLALLGAIVLLGGEAVMALNKDYPLGDPEVPVRGEFGDKSFPELNFVVLGDSTSVGVGTTPDKSFPWLIANWLSETRHVRLEVVGFGGATTRDLDDQVDRALELKPDLALIEIGANDTTHLTPFWTVRKLYNRTLDRLGEAGIPVVVAGPPDMGHLQILKQPLRRLTRLQSDKIMKTVEEVARDRGVPYVDLAGGILKQELPPGVPYHSVDDFHPGAGGYSLWAKAIYPTVAAEAAKL